MAYCPRCGTQVADDARICPNCSYALSPVGSSQEVAGQQPVAPDPAPQPPMAGSQAFPSAAPVPAQPKTDGGAIASLVLAIAGFVICPVIPSIIAIPIGLSAEKRIKESGGTLTGEGLAKVGWILGIVGLIVVVAFFLLFFAVFSAGFRGI